VLEVGVAAAGSVAVTTGQEVMVEHREGAEVVGAMLQLLCCEVRAGCGGWGNEVSWVS